MSDENTTVEEVVEEVEATEGEKAFMAELKQVISEETTKAAQDAVIKAAPAFVEAAQPVGFTPATSNHSTYGQKAVKYMSDAQKTKFASMDNVDQKKYAEDVVIASYVKALHGRNETVVKDLSEGTDSEGGYLVPAPLATRIYEIVTAQGHARKEMTVLPMATQTLSLNNLATKPTVYYVNEGAQITASDIAFGQDVLTATKVAAITAMSNEVIEDANIDLINYNIQKIAEAFMEEEDKAFFNTSTSANITGIIEDTGTNTTTMGSGDTSFANMAYGDLVDVVYSLDASQRVGAKWCMSSHVLSLAMKILDGNNLPIFNRGIEGQPSTLLGYPVIENDQMPGSGDDAVSTEFLTFGNYKNYVIGDRKGMSATVLREGTIGSTNLAEKDSSGLRVIQRICGVAPTPLSFATLKTAAA